jgi:PatG C-terminal
MGAFLMMQRVYWTLFGNRDKSMGRDEGMLRPSLRTGLAAGATDEHRACNYLAMRYPAINAKAADRPSPLSSRRNIVDVIFSYTNRNTDVTEKFFVRADVTEEFPFLVTKMSPYYDR